MICIGDLNFFLIYCIDFFFNLVLIWYRKIDQGFVFFVVCIIILQCEQNKINVYKMEKIYDLMNIYDIMSLVFFFRVVINQEFYKIVNKVFSII